MNKVVSLGLGLVIATGIAIAGVSTLVPSKPEGEPCPPNPCYREEDDEFDPFLCEEKADWIALGTLEEVGRQQDSDSFTFRIRKWETSQHEGVEELSFQTGACENSQRLPEDTSGVFRIYGKGDPVRAGHLQAKYYGFEKAL